MSGGLAGWSRAALAARLAGARGDRGLRCPCSIRGRATCLSTVGSGRSSGPDQRPPLPGGDGSAGEVQTGPVEAGGAYLFDVCERHPASSVSTKRSRIACRAISSRDRGTGMRRLPWLVIAVALIVSPAATAKDFKPGDLRVCGVRRCVPITDREVLGTFGSFLYRFSTPRPQIVRRPARGAPTVDLRFRDGSW